MSFHGFKNELLIYTLGLTFLTIILTTAIAVFSTKTAGDDAADATSAVLRTQAEELLIQITTAAAEQQDLLFEQIRNDTENLAFYTNKLYENQSIFSGNGYWDFNTRVIRKEGRYINNVSDISTFHIPSFVTLDADKKRNVEVTAALDFVVPSILNNNESIAAIYTIDKEGVTRYFPNIVLGELGPPDYDPREDIYYLPATPENNPGKTVVWSPLYEDVAGRGLMITATAPVYTNDGFAGIAATDVLLKSIIESITAYSPIEGSYVFLIDKEGTTIAFPDKAYEDILGRSRAPGEDRINLFDHALSKEFQTVLEKMISGTTGFGDFSNGAIEHLFMAYAPLKQTGFSIGVVAKEEVILKAVGTLRGEISDSIGSTIVSLIFPASLFIIFAAIIIGIFVANQVVRPVQKLTEGVREIGKGNLDYNIQVQSRNEIGELASSFRQMSGTLKESRQKLYEYSQGLEKQVKERTKELATANEELKRLDKAKSEFVSIASHQLRTPLTASKGYISLVLEGTYGALEEKFKKPLQKVYYSNERLIHLVNDLLSLSRIESGKMKLEKESTDISEIVKSVIEELQIKAEERGLKLVFKKPTTAVAQILLDKEKIRNVVLNLIDNAIRYTKEGSIITSVAQENGKLHIAVQDTGEGMTKEEIGKLFESFSRGQAGAKLSTEGAGLGLYIARQFVEMHKGKIWAESDGKGKGSTFHIELP